MGLSQYKSTEMLQQNFYPNSYFLLKTWKFASMDVFLYTLCFAVLIQQNKWNNHNEVIE